MNQLKQPDFGEKFFNFLNRTLTENQITTQLIRKIQNLAELLNI